MCGKEYTVVLSVKVWAAFGFRRRAVKHLSSVDSRVAVRVASLSKLKPPELSSHEDHPILISGLAMIGTPNLNCFYDPNCTVSSQPACKPRQRPRKRNW